MDVSWISELVSNVAFPIAAFILMFYTNTKTIEDLRGTITENTIVMTKLADKLDSMEADNG